jgi:HTH-type transcriptional regulator/antitoxin HigA
MLTSTAKRTKYMGAGAATINFDIKNQEELKVAFAQLDQLIAEGFQGDSEKEALFSKLARAIEKFEDSQHLMPLPHPQTLAGMIELKMFERKLNQKELAGELGITATRLSEVLNGKRKVNMDLARRLHEKLGIDAEFILEHA